MKKFLSVLLIALMLCSTCFMSGCGLFDALFDLVPTKYADADKYTAGNAEFEGKVDTFSIWWHHGKVTLKTHKENTVKIEETANKDIDDTFRLHWRYYYVEGYGNVLYVYYSASGDYDFSDLKKDITIYLPENDEMDLTFTTDTASVDVDTSGFENTIKEFVFCTNSGRLSAKIDSADQVRISGQNDEGVPQENREFSLKANGTVYDLGVSSSYAKVDVDVKSVRIGDVGSVFADVIFKSQKVRDLTLTNSRNKIYATVLEFDSIDIETFEAPCELILSPDASFKLSIKEKDRFNYKMSPKSVKVEFEGVVKDGSQYTVGAGEKTIKFASESDLVIRPAAE